MDMKSCVHYSGRGFSEVGNVAPDWKSKLEGHQDDIGKEGTVMASHCSYPTACSKDSHDD